MRSLHPASPPTISPRSVGLILVAGAIIGMVTGDIRTGLAILILVVGAINVLRAIPARDAS